MQAKKTLLPFLGKRHFSFLFLTGWARLGASLREGEHSLNAHTEIQLPFLEATPFVFSSGWSHRSPFSRDRLEWKFVKGFTAKIFKIFKIFINFQNFY